MKQTQNTHACSLSREGAAAYSLAKEVAVAVTGEWRGSGVLSGTRCKVTAVSRPREETLKLLLSVKQKQQSSAGLA